MRLPEQRMWDFLVSRMGNKWSAQRHEDKHEKGVPDVSFTIVGVSGWLELKTLPKWPSSPAKALRIPHLLPEQVNWIIERGQHGGNTALLLSVGADPNETDWIYIPWHDVRYLRDYGIKENHGHFTCKGYKVGGVAFIQRLCENT